MDFTGKPRKFSEFSGHVVLIVGMNANGIYTVLDPMFGTRICNYQVILHALGMGVWAYSFGVFKKRGN